jgi:hypothetical protein
MPEASYNGWAASERPGRIGVVPLIVDGVNFPPGVRSGPVHVVFSYLIHRLITEVEPAGEGCWGYAYRKNRNADNLSCHASGTAIDFNAPKHPNGKRGTFTPQQVQTIERILDDIGVVAWGGHFHGTPDEMHFEIHGTPSEVGAAARRLIQTRPQPVQEDDDMPLSDDDVQKVAAAAAAMIRKDLAVILRGTRDGTHPVNLTSIARAVKVPGV